MKSAVLSSKYLIEKTQISLMFLSIIIPCYNAEKTLKPLLEEIFNVKFPIDFEIIVVDDGSQYNYKDIIQKEREQFQERMSAAGAHIRDRDKINKAVKEAWEQYNRMKVEMKVATLDKLPAAFRNLDLCLTHAIYLEAFKEYLENGGKSRGSYLVLDPNGEKPSKELSDEWKFSLTEEDLPVNKKILEVYLDDKGNVIKALTDVRPIPKEDVWFENVWSEFRKDNIVR